MLFVSSPGFLKLCQAVRTVQYKINFYFPEFRNFLKSKWGMEEFIIADHEAVNGRKNFIIIILKDKLEMKGLRREVKTYLRTHTYIDGTKNPNQVPQRLRSGNCY